MIELTDLSFGYTQKNLFTHLNLTFKKSGIYGLLGKNGSGKTSLLKLITGLVFPNKGLCQVMEKIPKERQPSFLQSLYFLPEDIYVPALTIDDYVKFYAAFYPKFDKTLFKNCLQEFELDNSNLLTHFSHGQKKKFLLAFGLATHCELLILDEPSNGLDIPSKTQFRKLLASNINDERLFIISTHQVHDVENLIDSIVILEDGKIIFQQNMAAISQRLAIIRQPLAPDPTTCLYYEKDLTGYTTVVINNGQQETHIDIEILFNAILSNKEKFQQLFSEIKS